MIKLLVLADDFTGALDTGVQFSARGIPTLVTVGDGIDFHNIDIHMHNNKSVEDIVIVVDLESRHIPAEEAADKVASIVEQAQQSGVEYFYKKTDSTLRGNVGAELSALLKISGSRCLAYVPAYPKTGRTTEDGCQFVNGIPLHQTAFAKDPLNPISDSSIPAIIKAQSDCNVYVSKPPEYVLAAKALDSSIIVFDASTDQDLLKIGRLLKNTDDLRITAGCAGFAAVLPDLLGLKITEEAGQHVCLRMVESPETPHAKETLTSDDLQFAKKTLIICGSLNEVSLEQVRYAESEGWCSAAIPPEVLLHDSNDEVDMFDHVKIEEKDILSILSRDQKAIIKTLNGPNELNSYIRYGENLGLDKKEIHLRIAHNIGLLVKHISNQIEIGSFVVFGGDTALGIMEAMDWDGLMPRDEILPGIAISEVLCSQPAANSCTNKVDELNTLHRTTDIHNTYLITKAGGFGDKDVLIKIDKYLTEKGEYT